MLALIDPRDPELPLLLLRRSASLRSHPGQVALPGGAHSPEDGALWRTALREAEEEVGVPAAAVELRGRASVVPTWNSGFNIAPFVGLLLRPFEPRLSEGEVEDCFWLALLPGGRPARPALERVEVAEGAFEVSGYRKGDHFVWGATGAIVTDLLGRLGAAPG